MSISECKASNAVTHTTDLADFIEKELTEAVTARGYASLVVSDLRSLTSEPGSGRCILESLNEENF